MTEASVIERQKAPVYANYNRIDAVNSEYTRAILSRDYKGFGTGFETSNGVLELE